MRDEEFFGSDKQAEADRRRRKGDNPDPSGN
jgi:hypothetical protein